MSGNITREGEDEYGKYWEEETSRGWRKVKREKNGIQFSVFGSKTDDYIKAIAANGLELRLNEMSDRVEYKDGLPITDIVESILLNRLTDCDMKNEGKMRRAIHEAAHRNKYHPVREYLDGLEWDGEDHFSMFLSKLEMSSPLADVFWRKFLIGSIAKAIDAQQIPMLVLVGAQGKGKSRLVAYLCPLKKLLYEGAIHPDNKDCQIRLINNWIWEVAELDATTRKADRSALKNFVSQRIVKVRVPYGRYDIEKPAAAAMIGTVNEDGTGFLNDPSGNRRYMVVQMENIDWSYEEIDVNQLWAQMYKAYKDGESFELTYHEKEIQSEINLGYTMRTPLEELFLENFEYDPDDESEFITTMRLLSMLENLGLQGRQYTNKIELASLMTKLQIKKDRRTVGGKRQYGYIGIKASDAMEISL